MSYSPRTVEYEPTSGEQLHQIWCRWLAVPAKAGKTLPRIQIGDTITSTALTVTIVPAGDAALYRLSQR
jgi:hypothetical protein